MDITASDVAMVRRLSMVGSGGVIGGGRGISMRRYGGRGVGAE